MLTINKFQFKTDGSTLEAVMLCTGDEYITKIEVWNYDNEDYKRELPLTNVVEVIELPDEVINGTQDENIQIAITSIGLKNTMLRGIVYTIDKVTKSVEQYGIICSNLREFYLATIADLNKMNQSYQHASTISENAENNINMIMNILSAHKDAMSYGFFNDASYYYAQLSELCLNRR